MVGVPQEDVPWAERAVAASLAGLNPNDGVPDDVVRVAIEWHAGRADEDEGDAGEVVAVAGFGEGGEGRGGIVRIGTAVQGGEVAVHVAFAILEVGSWDGHSIWGTTVGGTEDTGICLPSEREDLG
jgi:hypothetical protein